MDNGILYETTKKCNYKYFTSDCDYQIDRNATRCVAKIKFRELSIRERKK